jgi:hypothetical protein
MRLAACALLLAVLVLPAIGCGGGKEFDGPTVDRFVGKIVKDGKPFTFPASDRLVIEAKHEGHQTFGIPISPDGTFEITWMPLGNYILFAEYNKSGQKGRPNKVTIPGGLQIVQGKTEYTIELGKNWKP